ncbi:DUF349 domain-containing protein [Thalassotalea piscium]
MIFSKLFKEKWQSKNDTIRLQAVEELSINNSSDKNILIQLIENDSNSQVRINALSKFNQFSLWIEASKNNNKTVRAFAEQQIENILLGLENIELTKEEKFSFLELKPSQSLLEKWLFAEPDSNLQITLYELINKPQLAFKLFTLRDNAKVQNYIIEQNDDIATLEKLAKKTHLKDVQSKISEKIASLTEAQEKPIKLAKQVQLILAKYLALKDIASYQEMLDKQSEIITQWHEVKAKFDILPEDKQLAFNDKWIGIETQLDKIFAIKAEDYKQQQILIKLAQDRAEQLEGFNLTLKNLNQQLSTSIYENATIDKMAFEKEIDRQLQLLSESDLDNKTQQNLSKLFNQERKQLLQLDTIAESITQATHLISQLSQVVLPQQIEEFAEKLAFYRDWQTQWQKVNKASCNLLPESITTSYQVLTKQWEEGIKPFEKSLKVQFNKVKHQLSDVKRLINSGKFNVCFGVFKKAETAYLLLTSQQQQALAKDYVWCQEKINELSDWESYIATPKKQSLLQEIQALADNPIDSPVEQAQKVKEYRKQWNSLGHAEAEINEELNAAFNLACEQAFAPCRLFYSEQEKLRSKHKVERENLISESEALKQRIEQPDVDWKKLDSDLNKLLQKWRNAGEVDQQIYHSLNKTFNQSLTPIKNAIHEFHESNAQKKQAVIVKAEALAKQDDIEQATIEIKSLQSKWREIGYSGSKAENKLWKAFRAINDDIFAKRKETQHATNESNNLKLNELAIEVQQLIDRAEQPLSIAQINTSIEEAALLKDKLLPLKPLSSQLNTQLIDFTKSLTHKKKNLLKQKANQSWHNLFSLLHEVIEQDIVFEHHENYINLDNKWKKRLKSLATDSVDHQSRKEKTIALEIIAGIKPPASEQALTMKVQVALMQQQLSNKEVVTIETAFDEWLALGKLTKDDLPLLSRIQALFTAETI